MLFNSFSKVFVGLLAVVPVFGQVTLNAPPTNPSPFEITGDINGMTLNPGTVSPSTDPFFRGGQLMVNGLPIVIPDNTLVTLPASIAAWSEFFANPINPLTNTPLPGNITYTAVVQGNRVGDLYIAGTVYFQQIPLQNLAGYISKIDLTTGHFWLAGHFSAATPASAGVGGMECVINDPTGVYGRAYTSNPLWGVDPENPCIRSTTGFPMCIPRSATADDNRCPRKNRPTTNGVARTQINFRNPQQAGFLTTEPDPRQMVPIAVGDYVTITGQQIGTIFEVTGMIVNAGIYTAPNAKPAYLAVEGVNVGVNSPSANVEVGETRAVLFTTDPTTPVNFYFVDVDGCTGAETERLVVTTAPQKVGQIGRVIIRMGKTVVSPATRNVRFRYTNGVSTNLQFLPGMSPGEYTQPIYDFIMPELINFGAPEEALPFENLKFLANGEGPFQPGNPLSPPLATPARLGPIRPWPGLTPPAPSPATCPPLRKRVATKSKRRAAIEAQLNYEENNVARKRDAEPAPETIETRQTTTTPAITSAVTKTRGGHFDTTVTATIFSATAQLSIIVSSSKEAVGPFPMQLVGVDSATGLATWTAIVQTKAKPSIAVVFATIGTTTTTATKQI